jgi:hypothetical protein
MISRTDLASDVLKWFADEERERRRIFGEDTNKRFCPKCGGKTNGRECKHCGPLPPARR